MKTLFEQVTECLYYESRKHGLGEDFSETFVNKMSNTEFLHEISTALEAVLADFAKEIAAGKPYGPEEGSGSDGAGTAKHLPSAAQS